MKTFKHLLAALPLMGLLTACVITGPLPDENVDPAQFIALAGQSPCANGGNRLFNIDNRYVYWDRGASCQDQVQRLYAGNTDRLLCVHSDTAKGPYTNCTDPAARALFDIILANRYAPDLGLGPARQVTQLQTAAEDSVNLVFTTVVQEAFSGIRTQRELVIRSAPAWAALWELHTAGRSPAPPLPAVDFSTHMLIAIFAGDTKGCRDFEIRKVDVVSGQVAVDYENRDITPTAICVAAITNPMHVVAVPLIEAEVAFAQVVPVRIEFNTIDRSAYSLVRAPMTVIVKDAQSWAQLWKRHTGTTGDVPPIDFSTTIVIGVFRGVLPNGCYSTEITDVYREDQAITVERRDTVPGPEAVCTLAIVAPAHIVAIPRTEEPVQVAGQRLPIP